jgi:hypothetical protein
MPNYAGNNVKFYNNGGFACSFSVQWDGGQTDRTGTVLANQSSGIDMTNYVIPENTSCWARAYINGGRNHDSGRNFNFVRANKDTVEYTITGGVATPSFD